jgi:exodeoxyribonuclease V alpha subunit
VTSPWTRLLEQLQEEQALSGLDLRFGTFMVEIEGGSGDAPELLLAAALASRAVRSGHVCLDLARIEDAIFPQSRPEGLPPFPESREWISTLHRARVVGKPGDFTPLILDSHGRLYLHRYWSYQESLARSLRERFIPAIENPNTLALRDSLTRLFPSPESREETDWQKVAACVAWMRRFTVISGGPGTGKTTIVSRMLALFVEQSGSAVPRIAMAAPTGKAAARLGEAVRRAIEGLSCADSVKAAIPTGAFTIHRLLGTIRHSPYFRHHAGNPLPVDVLVVDEASMVDLALMAKLVDALLPAARLVLLGDRDQLASVEAGAILADLCGTERSAMFSPPFRKLLQTLTEEPIPKTEGPLQGPSMRDGFVLLPKSYRFEKTGGIGAFSRAVNDGNVDQAIALLRDESMADLHWSPLPSTSDLNRALKAPTLASLAQHVRETDPDHALDILEQFRILCGLREGPYGSQTVNLLIERTLVEQRVVSLQGRWYAGKPVMVTRNDYELRLFNGDVGIILPSPEENGMLRAFFPTPDGGVRRVHPLQLPEHETAFAMTVHKSQGSEFDRVLLILPDRPSPVLTREMLYTAVSRARKAVEIWAPEAILRSAIARRTFRGSGLGDALREKEEEGPAGGARGG